MLSHYDWCDKHLSAFLFSLDIEVNVTSLLSTHGDKAYGYRSIWLKQGIPFNHGVAIYLLSYLHPYSEESRDTSTGWIPVEQWVAHNYDRFKSYLYAA